MRIGKQIEDSTPFQAVMSGLIALIALAVIGWNLPAGRPHDRAVQVVHPLVQGLGLEQDWALFAPDPRSFGVGVYATLTYKDGHTATYQPPHNGLFFTPYRNYRWQKYVERLRADDYQGLWDPTARWLARQKGPGVVKVDLIRTFRDATIPGDGKSRPATGHYLFYSEDFS